MSRLVANKEQKAAAAAAREAAKAKQLEQEARLNLLRQQLAEAEEQAAAAVKEAKQADLTIEQLALEARISLGRKQRVVNSAGNQTSQRYLTVFLAFALFLQCFLFNSLDYNALTFIGCKYYILKTFAFDLV